MSDTPISFPTQPSKPRPPAADTGYRLPGTLSLIPKAQAGPAVHGSMALPIEIDKLYPAEEDSKEDVIAALGLLAEAISTLEKARTAAHNKAPMEADRYLLRFQVLLPELFRRRSIGDGYGAIINSLHFTFINQHGKPLSFEQLTTVWRIVKELRNGPFVPFEQALRSIAELEDCDLQVYPSTISEFLGETEEAEAPDEEEEPEDE